MREHGALLAIFFSTRCHDSYLYLLDLAVSNLKQIPNLTYRKKFRILKSGPYHGHAYMLKHEIFSRGRDIKQK